MELEKILLRLTVFETNKSPAAYYGGFVCWLYNLEILQQ